MKTKISKLISALAVFFACSVPAFAGNLPHPESSEDVVALVVICILALVPIAAYIFVLVSAVIGFCCARKAKARLAFEKARIYKAIPVPSGEVLAARERANALFAEYAEKWLGGAAFDSLRDGVGIAQSGAATEVAFETLEKMKKIPEIGNDRVAADMLNVFGAFANRSQERENLHISKFRGGIPFMYGWVTVVLAPVFAAAMLALWIFLAVGEGIPTWGHIVFAAIIIMSLLNAFVAFTNVTVAKTVFLTPRRLVLSALDERWMRFSLKALEWGAEIDRGFCAHLAESMRQCTYYYLDKNDSRYVWVEKDHNTAFMMATYANAVKKGIRGQIIQVVFGFVIPWKTPAIYRRNFESEN